MAGSCAGSWWLLFVIAHFLLVRLAPTYCQQTQGSQLTFLLTIKSNQSGLEIRTYPLHENHGQVNNSGARLWPAHELRSQVNFIPDRRLSSGCDEQYFRCQELLVEPYEVDNGTLNVVFVPLEGGVLVLFNKWSNSNSSTLNWNTVIKNTTNCSPTVFYKFSGHCYMVCISLHITLEIFVYVVELNVKDSVIKESDIIFRKQLAVNKVSDQLLTSNLSNFVVVKNKIFVAIGNIIASIDVGDPNSRNSLPLKNCTQIHNLVPTFDTQYGQMLVALCTDRIIYISCDQIESLIQVQHYASNGSVLYVCPDNEYNATLTLLRLNLLQNYFTVNISSGICFKTLNRTYFAYSDQNLNKVFVYDFITQDINCVSPYYCPNMNCPLDVENEYLVVREVNHALVFDTTNNFSLVINISVALRDILAILDLHIIDVNSAVTPSPPVTSHENTTTSSIPSTTPDVNPTSVGPVQKSSVTVISTVVTGLLVIIILIIVAVAVGLFTHSCSCSRRKWCSKMYRIPRLRFSTNQSQSISLLAADSDQDEESYEMKSHSGKGSSWPWRWTTTV